MAASRGELNHVEHAELRSVNVDHGQPRLRTLDVLAMRGDVGLLL